MNRQIIILILVFLNTSCLTFVKPTKIAYLMPAGFIGGVIVLYKQPDGITPEISADGTITYRIPPNGLLKVNSDFGQENYDYKFYYVDDKNNLTPIEYVDPQNLDTLSENEKNNKIFVMNHRVSGLGRPNEPSMPLYAFSVGYPKDSRHLYIQTLDKMDEINEQQSKKRR